MSVTLNFKATSEMNAQLDAYIKANPTAVKSAVMREAIAGYLAQHDFPVGHVHPQRGGDRKSTDDK